MTEPRTLTQTPEGTVEGHSAQIAAIVPAAPVVAQLAGDSLGLVLARPVRAAHPLPPFDNSAMDGVAVRAADVCEARPDRPVRLRLDGSVAAGRTDRVVLRPGTAVRIMTGAPVAEGADAVIPVERLTELDGDVVITDPVGERRHIRRAGEDVRAGSIVLRTGTRLGAAPLGLLAGLGVDTVHVRRPLRVGVVATGSELTEGPVGHGRIRDVNGPLLEQALRAEGLEVVRPASVPDEPARLLRLLDELRGRVDLVVTAGGISAGDHEVVRDALSPEGLWFGRIAMHPGAPQGVGELRGLPVVAFPGNPVAAWVSYHVLLRPVLRVAMGAAVGADVATLPVLADLHCRPGRREYRLGRVQGHGVLPLPSGSHRVGVLAESDVLIATPSDREHVGIGSTVRVLRTG